MQIAGVAIVRPHSVGCAVGSAGKTRDQWVGHGRDAGAVTLGTDETILIPFPVQSAGPQYIAATPNGGVTFKAPPLWLDELVNSYEAIL